MAQKRENVKRKLAAAAPRSSDGKILSKVQLKSAILKSAAQPVKPKSDVTDGSSVEKKSLPPSAFEVLGKNGTQGQMGVTRIVTNTLSERKFACKFLKNKSFGKK